MAPQQNTSHDGSTAPVACTLTTADLAAQHDRWQRLGIRALTGRAETAQGLRLSFRPVPGAEEELRQLAAVETQCCPWATWMVRTHAGHLVLDIRTTGDGIAALHGMFTSLVPALPARRW